VLPLNCGLEACNKFAVHLIEFKACYQRLSDLRRVEDIPWATVDWEDLSERVGAVRERLVRALSLDAFPNWPRCRGQRSFRTTLVRPTPSLPRRTNCTAKGTRPS
jgi:hypothetical protein